MNKFLSTLSLLLVTATVPLTVQAQDILGSATAGSKKNALCIGCHGIQGYHIGFPEVHKIPKLSGQSATYISSALQAYKTGERKHPSMRTLASSLTEQDMADLAAYYEADGAVTAMPENIVPGPQKANDLVTQGACISCHGPNLSKPIAPGYPKIAGQHSDYLYVALRSYKTNEKPLIGRSHPIMGAMAKQFSNADLKVLADYIGGLPGELRTVQRDRVK